MAKLLDLNSLAPEKKEVLLYDRKYTIKPLTVGLLRLLKSINLLILKINHRSEQLEAGIEIVQKLIPDMSEEDIQQLPLEAVQAIIVFAFQSGEAVNNEHVDAEAK
ncbi:hypothetical protein AB6G29_24160 [Providencia hangzhouensis]|uniref:hypothetical protein n=1 Tax=Providencia hangzhouensis TaxID=3031799 RepID=UPI0034DD73E4